MADQTFEVELRIDLNAPNLRGELSRALGDLNQSVTGFDQKIAGVQKNLDGAGKATKDFSQGLSTTRYALYDVSSTLAITGAALLGVAVATAAVAIAWERDFANVARTSGLVGSALDELRTDFVDLAQTMPTAFGDLTKIGTLGSQLGIASKDLASFTQTVVKFSTATGISAEQSAMAFGRLGNILGVTSDEYEKLGSSIAFAGLKAVATEAEIVAVAQQIGPIARLSGVAAHGVVGLATAMASVKIPPELARSVITKTFGDIQKAVETASPKLAAFGEVAGMSGAEFQKAWRADATGAFVELLKGITTNGEGAYAALDKIGITSRRDTPALLKLAQNYGLVSSSLANSKQGFEEGSELNRQYGIIAETTAAKLQVLANGFQALLDAIGSANLGPLNAVLDTLTGFFGFLTDVASTDIGGKILGIVAILAGLGGVLAIAAAGLALFGASTIGMQQGLAGIVALAPNASAKILGVGTASAIASGGMAAATASAKLLWSAIRALTLIGALLLLPDLMTWGADVARGARDVDTSISAMTGRIKAEFADLNKSALDNFGEFGATMNRAFAGADAGLLRDIKEVDEGLTQMVASGNADAAAKQFYDLKAAWLAGGGEAEVFNKYFTDTNNALKDAAPAADGATASLGTVEEQLAAVEAEAQAAQQAIDALRDAVLNFGASTISVEQTQIALSRAFNSMTEAAANADATLDGTNAASLTLRDSFIDIDKAARDAALAIVENGGSVEEATAKYNESRQAIIDARVAKGEDAEVAAAWADSVLGSAGEAQGAIKAYSDEINRVPATKGTDLQNNAEQRKGPIDHYRDSIFRIPTYWKTEIVTNYSSTGQVSNRPAPNPNYNFATGGPVHGPGTGTSDSILARLSNDEYVITAAAHQRYGTALFDALNSGRVPKFASGGQVGATQSSGMLGGVVELGPKTMKGIAREVNITNMLDDEAISRAAQRGNEKRRANGDFGG